MLGTKKSASDVTKMFSRYSFELLQNNIHDLFNLGIRSGFNCELF